MPICAGDRQNTRALLFVLSSHSRFPLEASSSHSSLETSRGKLLILVCSFLASDHISENAESIEKYCRRFNKR
jgi:hypothetical protein